MYLEGDREWYQMAWGYYCALLALYSLSKLPWSLGFADSLGLPNGNCGARNVLELAPLFRTGVVQEAPQAFIAVHSLLSSTANFVFAAVLLGYMEIRECGTDFAVIMSFNLVVMLPFVRFPLYFLLDGNNDETIALATNASAIGLCFSLLICHMTWSVDTTWPFYALVAFFNIPSYMEFLIIAMKGSSPNAATGKKYKGMRRGGHGSSD